MPQIRNATVHWLPFHLGEKRLSRTSGTLNARRNIGNVRQRKLASATCSTTPSGRYAPLPRTDRLLSCDEFLHVIAVGSIAAEFLLIKQAPDPASQAHLIRVLSLSHWPAHFAVPAAAQKEHRRSARSSSEQARPCPARPALLLLVHLGHSAAFWFNDTKPPTDLPHPSGSHRELSARSAIWQGHGLWITLAGGKFERALSSIISSLLLLPLLLYHSLE